MGFVEDGWMGFPHESRKGAESSCGPRPVLTPAVDGGAAYHCDAQVQGKLGPARQANEAAGKGRESLKKTARRPTC